MFCYLKKITEILETMPSSLPTRYYQYFDKHRQISSKQIHLQIKLDKFSRVLILLSSLMQLRMRLFYVYFFILKFFNGFSRVIFYSYVWKPIQTHIINNSLFFDCFFYIHQITYLDIRFQVSKLSSPSC